MQNSRCSVCSVVVSPSCSEITGLRRAVLMCNSNHSRLPRSWTCRWATTTRDWKCGCSCRHTSPGLHEQRMADRSLSSRLSSSYSRHTCLSSYCCSLPACRSRHLWNAWNARLRCLPSHVWNRLSVRRYALSGMVCTGKHMDNRMTAKKTLCQ